jgi:glycosyltransferase involved in cell wall biosynthesis
LAPRPLAHHDHRMPPDRPIDLSVVIPIHDEEPALAACFQRLAAVLDGLDLQGEVIAVDDGSSDGSLAWLRLHQSQEPLLVVLALSLTFGNEAALSAVPDHARSA